MTNTINGITYHLVKTNPDRRVANHVFSSLTSLFSCQKVSCSKNCLLANPNGFYFCDPSRIVLAFPALRDTNPEYFL